VKEATLESVESAPARAELDAARDRAGVLFEALGAPVPRRSGDTYHLCETFAALLAMSDAEVMQVIAVAMAETLESGVPGVEAALHASATDPGAFWQPDAAFFDLLRDRRVTLSFLTEVVSPEAARKAENSTLKAQKAQLVSALAARDGAKGDAWTPGWMQLPPTRHVERAACPPVDAWARIAGLFEAVDAETSADQLSPCKASAA
jgi:ParB family chromosome partitioning protein